MKSLICILSLILFFSPLHPKEDPIVEQARVVNIVDNMIGKIGRAHV